jgi:hypothetical protein
MSINKQISQDRWLEFCDQFSDGNKGRKIQSEVIDREAGDLIPVDNAAASDVSLSQDVLQEIDRVLAPVLGYATA